uniref:Uncharacterized protein n=1 Tax=Rhizophora mucronata TaxID=61149 RepID=A0A2P2Q4S0_RHIMU
MCNLLMPYIIEDIFTFLFFSPPYPIRKGCLACLSNFIFLLLSRKFIFHQEKGKLKYVHVEKFHNPQKEAKIVFS